jgi:hypothetical protein
MKRGVAALQRFFALDIDRNAGWRSFCRCLFLSSLFHLREKARFILRNRSKTTNRMIRPDCIVRLARPLRRPGEGLNGVSTDLVTTEGKFRIEQQASRVVPNWIPYRTFLPLVDTKKEGLGRVGRISIIIGLHTGIQDVPNYQLRSDFRLTQVLKIVG